METVPATKTANVIELRPATVTQEKREGHVFSEAEGGQGQIRTESASNPGQIRPEIAVKILRAIQERATANADCRTICHQIICAEAVITHLMDIINAEDVTRFEVGFESLLASGFNTGAAVNFSELMLQTAKAHSELSITFIREQIKPVLEWLGILVKKPDNTFRWATLEELQASPYAAEKPVTDTTEAATVVQPNGLFRLMDCIGDAVLNPAQTCNKPFSAIRRRQQNRRLERAKKDPYATVHDNGTIQYLPKPLEGELTEAEKELIRQAAKAEREGKLKAKIAAWKDKEAQTEWRNIQMQAAAEQQAITQQYLLKAAELRGKREMAKEKLRGYVPFLFAAGIVTFIGLKYAAQADVDVEDETNPYSVQIADVASQPTITPITVASGNTNQKPSKNQAQARRKRSEK